jgi:hypothetical protein
VTGNLQPGSFQIEIRLYVLYNGKLHCCFGAWVRQIIRNRFSKRQFLVDTGSDLCVYPAGSSHDVGNASNTTTSVRLAALPSTPTEGCLSASNWYYAENSRGDSWWPTSHIPSSASNSFLISASWWTAEITTYWTGSHHCLFCPEQPAHGSPASRPSVAAHRTTAFSPNSGPHLPRRSPA